jgi:hypothetical protein
MIHRNQGATRHPRRCNGTNGNGKEEDSHQTFHWEGLPQFSKVKRRIKLSCYDHAGDKGRGRGKGRGMYSFLTSALDGGEWSASRPGRSLPPGKEPPVSIVQEAGWTSEPVWTQRLEKNYCDSPRDRTSVVQSAVRHCTDGAIPALILLNTSIK